MSDELRAISISLENIQCLPKAELRFRKPEPGKGQLITLVGDNGVGKTSILEGIASVFEGGHNPAIIRTGADRAEARMTLSNGTDIRRTITRKGYSLKITTEEGAEMKAPETYVKKLATGFGFDPIAFDQADKKARLQFLLQVMPISFTADEIRVALGDAANLLAVPTGTLDINTLGKFVKELIEKRAVTGSRLDEKASSVEALRKTLLQSDSADDPKDWKAEVVALKKRRDDLDGFERGDVEDVAAEARQARNSKRTEIQNLDDTVRSEFTRLLELARAGEGVTFDVQPIASLLGKLSAESAYARSIDKAEAEAIQAIRDKNAKEREFISALLATAEAGADAQTSSAAVRTEMEKFRALCVTLKAEYEVIAAAVKNLEELKRSKLDDLPVSGLEVRDGDIFLNGIEWDRVNQAKRWLKSIEIGAQGIGGLGLMVCDAAEHLGPTNWQNFEEAVVESGMTVIAARVATPEEIATHGPQLRSEPQNALALA